MAAANTILAEVAEYEACGVCDTGAVKRAVKLLTTAPMDGGLVCESIDPVTGCLLYTSRLSRITSRLT